MPKGDELMAGKYPSCTEYWLNTEDMTFRGEFETMYEDIEDPWGCAAVADSLNNRLFLEILFSEREFKRILDVGCGLGAFTQRVKERQPEARVSGCDISATAIRKAGAAYREIDFFVLDIQKEEIPGQYDLVILSEVLWYILDNVGEVFAKIRAALRPGGLLAIHQYFPDEQRYGAEIIPGAEGFDCFIESRTPFRYERKIFSFGNWKGKVLLATLEK